MGFEFSKTPLSYQATSSLFFCVPYFNEYSDNVLLLISIVTEHMQVKVTDISPKGRKTVMYVKCSCHVLCKSHRRGFMYKGTQAMDLYDVSKQTWSANKIFTTKASKCSVMMLIII